MLKIAANKSASAPTAPPCLIYHRERVQAGNARGERQVRCEDCGTVIPPGPYSPADYQRFFGRERTFLFGRPSDEPAPVDLANPPTAEDLAADALAAEAEAALVRAREKLVAAGRALEHAEGSRSWMTGEPNGDVDRAAAAVASAHEEVDEADETVRKALVKRNVQQRIRDARRQQWLNEHRDQW